MRRPRTAAARRSLSIWRGSPPGTRLHCHIRWWTAPFAALEPLVPAQGAILEVGCGHGLFSTFLALTASGREVRGIDVDGDKIELAGRAIARLAPGEANIAFEHVPDGVVPRRPGGWDAIVVVDVLYLLSPTARHDLIAQCVGALVPGGVLVVKEVDTSPWFKAKVAQLQEFLATRVLRITATHHDLHFRSADDVRAALDDAGLTTTASRLDRGYFHPHCVVVGTKPLRTT